MRSMLPPAAFLLGSLVWHVPVVHGQQIDFTRDVRRLNAEDGTITPVSGQASHQLASMARANALIIVPEAVTEMREGSEADVLVLP